MGDARGHTGEILGVTMSVISQKVVLETQTSLEPWADIALPPNAKLPIILCLMESHFSAILFLDK